MKLWLRLTLITLTVGGGFTGFSVTLQQLFKPQSQEPVYFILLVVFLALYAFVTASGLVLVQNPRRTGPLFIAIAMQIPWVCSPLISYRFTSGFHVTIGLIGGSFGGGFHFGSDWQCSVFQQIPWGIGVNLFAVLVLVLLARSVQPPDVRLPE